MPRQSSPHRTAGGRPPAHEEAPLQRPPLVVPIFLPQLGCPHQCSFCNQTAVTGIRPRLPSAEELRASVRRFRSFSGKPRGAVHIAFFGGNFLGLPRRDRIGLLDAAAAAVRCGEADGIRLSTRPDSVCGEALEMLARYPVAAVEVGAQSMQDRVLAAARRGHTAADTVGAVERLKLRGYSIGVQLMVGLPQDDESGAVSSGRRIAALAPDFVRIYPALVLAGSRLAELYRRGRYRPLSLAAAVSLTGKLVLLFQERGIPVVRMGLHPSEELDRPEVRLAGPYHPAFGDLVHSEIFMQKALQQTAGRHHVGELCFRTHPRNVSRLRGHGSRNVRALQERFGRRVRVVADPRLDLEAVVLDSAAGTAEAAPPGCIP